MTAVYGRHSAPPAGRLAGLRLWLRKLARRRRAAAAGGAFDAGEFMARRMRRLVLFWNAFVADNFTDDPADLPPAEVSEGTWPYDPADRTRLPRTKPWAPVDTDVIDAVSA